MQFASEMNQVKMQGHSEESNALVNKHHSLNLVSHICRYDSLQNVIINTRYEGGFEYLMSNDCK